MLWTHSHTEYARAQCEWSVMRLKKHTIYLSELEKNNSKSWMFGKLYLDFSITITWNNCKYKFIFKINKTKMSLNIHVTAIVHINWKYQMTPPPLSLSLLKIVVVLQSLPKYSVLTFSILLLAFYIFLSEHELSLLPTSMLHMLHGRANSIKNGRCYKHRSYICPSFQFIVDGVI